MIHMNKSENPIYNRILTLATFVTLALGISSCGLKTRLICEDDLNYGRPPREECMDFLANLATATGEAKAEETAQAYRNATATQLFSDSTPVSVATPESDSQILR